ncbi:putative molybdenum cofactor biosynthesis pathway protein [Haematococcus lacustris]
MVDVSSKAATSRSATASCRVMLGQAAFSLVVDNARQSAKGNVLGTAQLAGIMAAKQTSALIPLCHNIPLSKVGVEFELDPSRHAVHISAQALTVSNTGVEMEALTAASVAALTVYDMCKAVSKDIEITALRLEAKSGGRSGSFRRTVGMDTVNE